MGSFELHAPLAKGGMGAVWRGVHASGVPVAVKVLTEKSARETQYLEAFRNEVRAVARLTHPHVVLVLDHGVVPAGLESESKGKLVAGSPYLVMELGDSTLDPKKLKTWPQVLEVATAVLDALAHAHARGVVHRDLKPSNMLVCGRAHPRPGVKLTDFGLAWLSDDGATDIGLYGGTPAYMAPEQATGSWRDYGPATDLYALGCFVWRMVCRRAPFRGNMERVMLAHVNKEPPAFVPAMRIPRDLEQWLRILMAKSPERRFASAAQAATALLALETPSLGHSRAVEVDPAMPTVKWTPTRQRLGVVRRAGERRSVNLDDVPPVPATWRRPDIDALPPRIMGAGMGVYSLRTVPLVGRDRERETIWESLRTASETATAKVICIRGPAGMGKTRLAGWVATRAQEVGAALTFSSGADPSEGPTAVAGRMLDAHLSCQELDRAATSERLVNILGLAPDHPDLGHLVATLRAETHAEQESAARYGAIARAMRTLARGRVPIVLVDDAQWAADALALLACLRDLPGPALLIACFREDSLTDRPLEQSALDALAGQDATRTIDLGPLTDHEVIALLADLLRLDETLVARVAERAQGSPAMAVQLVGDCIERGLLEASDRGFRLRPGVKPRLPDDLQELWSSRVDEVLSGQPSGAEGDLEIAAVLGTEVVLEQWQAACSSAERLGALVEALLERRLATATDRGWSFAHVGLRECLVRRAREAGRLVEHHTRCAETLADAYHRGEVGVSERYGRHLLAAGDSDGAVRALLQGVQERRNLMGSRAALSLLADCESAAQTGTWTESTARCVALRVGLLRAAGDLAAAETAALEALALLESGSGESTEDALYESGVVSFQRRDWEAAFERLEHGRALAGSRGSNPSRFLNALAGVHAVRHEHGPALACAEQALAAATAHEDRQEIARSLWRQAVTRLIAGHDRDPIRTQLKAAREMYVELGVTRQVATVTHTLAEVESHEGNHAAAETELRRALAMDQRLGRGQTHLTALALALTLVKTGRLAEAAHIAGPIRRECLEKGRLPFASHAGSILLLHAGERGDWVTWDRLATPELAERLQAPDTSFAALLFSAGKAAASYGEHVRARWAYLEAQSVFRAAQKADKTREVQEALEGLTGADE